MFKLFSKKQEKKEKPNIKVYGSSETEISVEEIFSELQPPSGLRKFSSMEDNEPIIGGLMIRLSNIFKSAEWTVEGENAALVKEQLDALPEGMVGLLEDFTNAFVYGFSVNEKIWTAVEGQIVLADLIPLHQPTLEFSNYYRGIVIQTTTAKGRAEIPLAKLVHFIPRTRSRNPYGRSLLRSAYKPYYYKSAIEASEAQSIDRTLSGLPVMTAPEGFDFINADEDSPGYDPYVAATLEWAESVVSKVRKDEMQGVVKPSGWELALLKGDNSITVNSPDILARYNIEMAISLLQTFAIAGGFGSTSGANIDSLIGDFRTSCNAWLKFMAFKVNRQIVQDICQFNLKDQYPEFRFFEVSSEKLADLASYVSRLVANEIIDPTETLERRMLEKIRIPYTLDKKPRTKE